MTCETNRLTLSLDARAVDLRCQTRLPDLRSLVCTRDNCGLTQDPSIIHEPPSGTFLGVGTHDITFNASDLSPDPGPP